MRADRYLAGAVLFLGLAALLSQCDSASKAKVAATPVPAATPGSSCPAGQTFSLPSAGGTFTFVSPADAALSATLNVPPNAVSSTTDVTIAPACNAPADANLLVNSAYDVTLGGVTLAAPATLTLAYDAAALGSLPESGLSLVGVAAGAWAAVTGATLDTTANTLTTTVTGGGTWGIWLSCVDGSVVTVANGTLTCTAGAYVLACSAGFGDCNANIVDGCETSTATDIANCGTCGTACSANNDTPTCSAGVCTVACTPGFADCDFNAATGCETNTAIDPNHCATCATVCSPFNMATVTCGAGVCNGTCAGGFLDCNGNRQIDGCEVNILIDPIHCGSCGTPCSPNHVPTPTCGGGICNGICAGGFADCNGNRQIDGCETSVATDPNNCGGCGIVCSANHMASVTCGAGFCNGICAAGYADCNSNRQVDGCETGLLSDPNNCGACGHVCSGGTLNCSSGTCVP